MNRLYFTVLPYFTQIPVSSLTMSIYFIFQISLALTTESYDENHFTVAISLPVSLTLRQHSICLHLASKLEGFDEDEVIPIKQVSCIHSNIRIILSIFGQLKLRNYSMYFIAFVFIKYQREKSSNDTDVEVPSLISRFFLFLI